MSRLTDLIAQAKAKDPQLGADLDQEFKQLSSRLSPRAKALLRVAAARELRSASNMVEHLVLEYCVANGILDAKQPNQEQQTDSKDSA